MGSACRRKQPLGVLCRIWIHHQQRSLLKGRGNTHRQGQRSFVACNPLVPRPILSPERNWLPSRSLQISSKLICGVFGPSIQETTAAKPRTFGLCLSNPNDPSLLIFDQMHAPRYKPNRACPSRLVLRPTQGVVRSPATFLLK